MQHARPDTWPCTHRTAPTAARARRAPRWASIGWMQHNLFSSCPNALLTIIGFWLSLQAAVRRARLGGLLGGLGRATTAASAAREDVGACWPFVTSQVQPVHLWPLSRRRALAGQPHVRARACGTHAAADAPRHAGQEVCRGLSASWCCPCWSSLLLSGGYARPAAGADGAVGRPAGQPRRRDLRHRRLVPGRHRAGARTPLAHAGRALGVDLLHRVRARGAADHHPVHVVGDAAAVPARRRFLRQAAAGADRGHAVLRRLHGRDHPRRPAGHPARPVRGGRRARPPLSRRRWASSSCRKR